MSGIGKNADSASVMNSLPHFIWVLLQSPIWKETYEVRVLFLTMLGMADSDRVYRGSLKELLQESRHPNPLLYENRPLNIFERQTVQLIFEECRQRLARLVDIGQIAKVGVAEWQLMEDYNGIAHVTLKRENARKRQAAYYARKKLKPVEVT